MGSIVPSSIGLDWIKAFDEVIEERFGALDMASVLVYLIDIVNADALPILAKQFDVLGYKGWLLADTEQKQRDLIKQAIELHRYKGTPWSIKAALERLGYPNAQIQEGVGTIYYLDGTWNLNGSITLGASGHWAYFRVLFNFIDFTTVIPAADLEKVTGLILEYKNERSHLYGVTFELDVEDTLELEDENALGVGGMTSNGAVMLDGQFNLDGLWLLGDGFLHDEVTITII